MKRKWNTAETREKAPWNSAGGFKILCKRFDEAIIFVAFAENEISTSDALIFLLNINLKTGVFQTQYKVWHALPENQRILINTLYW